MPTSAADDPLTKHAATLLAYQPAPAGPKKSANPANGPAARPYRLASEMVSAAAATPFRLVFPTGLQGRWLLKALGGVHRGPLHITSTASRPR
jgi:hypothetical protein